MGIENEIGVTGTEFPIEQAAGPVIVNPGGEVRLDFRFTEIGRKAIVVVLCVEGSRDIELAVIIETEDCLRLIFAAGEGGEEEGGENGDDRNDDEQFNQCKSGRRCGAETFDHPSFHNELKL